MEQIIHVKYQIIWHAFALFTGFLKLSKCAQILGIFGTASISHHSMNQPIMQGLAARGHKVIILSTFNSSGHLDNYTEHLMDVGRMKSYVYSVQMNQLSDFQYSWNSIKQSQRLELNTCETALSHEFIRNIVKSKEKPIDLLIVETYSSLCYNLLAEKLDVPMVTISPTSMNLGNNFMIGNRDSPSYVPMLSTVFTTHMDFLERLQNTLACLSGFYYHYDTAMLNLSELADKYLDMKEVPSLDVLQRRVALIFFNNHNQFISKAIPPNIVNIAGVHIKEAKSLPENLQTILDSAKNGAILFSFGTAVNASTIPSNKLEILKNVFSKVPQTILWRGNESHLTDVPKNVIVQEWFPQRDLLEHKNMKAFVSHCGLFGTLEAMNFAIPVIGIPLFFDQKQNSKILVEKGMAIMLNLDEMTEESLLNALNNIINDTRYRENALKVSTIFKDRLVSPLDEALYWIEYVLKFKNMTNLRPTSADLPIYQYLLLDVIAFLIVIFIVILCLIIVLLKLCYECVIKTTNVFRSMKKKI